MAFLKKKKTMAAMPLKGAKQAVNPNMATNMPVNPLSPTQTAELTTMVAENTGKLQQRIDLNLPKNNKQKDKRFGVNPYMFGENPEPGVNILGIGAGANLNLLNRGRNRLDLTGNASSVSVGHTGGVELFGKPQFSAGLKFKHTFGSNKDNKRPKFSKKKKIV